MIKDLCITREQFIKAASIGLHDEENKKFFEQIIACENFLYFKNMMIRRNLQLEEQAYKMLYENLEEIGFGFGIKEQKAAIERGLPPDVDLNALALGINLTKELSLGLKGKRQLRLIWSVLFKCPWQ